LSSRDDNLTREEVLEWLKARVGELEFELKVLKTIVALLDTTQKALVGERVEDVKIGKRRVARVYIGDTYVRVAFETPLVMPLEVKEYLKSVEEDLRVLQARTGSEGELARLSIRERPDGSVAEVRIENLQSTIEIVKAKAALKYAVEVAHQLLKAKDREIEEVA
jgi:DnaJ-class molecular chaperone